MINVWAQQVTGAKRKVLLKEDEPVSHGHLKASQSTSQVGPCDGMSEVSQACWIQSQVASIRRRVAQELQLPEARLKLVHKGQTLQDWTQPAIANEGEQRITAYCMQNACAGRAAPS